MSDFLKKVTKAIEHVGESPYDDQKTDEAVSKATQRTVEKVIKEFPGTNYPMD